MAGDLNGHSPDYVVCKCSRNYVKLNLPILVTPDGRHLACIVCFTLLDDCQPARHAQVVAAGLPVG